jgi:hypothetical protein
MRLFCEACGQITHQPADVCPSCWRDRLTHIDIERIKRIAPGIHGAIQAQPVNRQAAIGR